MMASRGVEVRKQRGAARRGEAGAGHRARLFVLLALLIAIPSWAHDLSVDVDSAREGCEVSGGFHVPVSDSVAWSVLSDYDHIGNFVSSMRSSRVERRDSTGLHVRQVAVGGMFIFHKRVQVL